ncbi:ABC transporter ATP-binding protein [Niveispirillum sp. KHB5.9]|uniref:ABC transporter ATP-binding protein n=1 Tax=Niveispirillum sp. KHB5.9 TaxID=3400269 RepID=UPI003A85400D
METALVLEGVEHAYLGRTVVSGVDMRIGAGEITALVGPSGCGKSTVAQIASGLIEPSRGRVSRLYRRHGMVFQEPRLLAWATAHDNIAYPLRLAATARRDRSRRVAAAAARVSLEPADLLKYPVELSGGMRQRAAIARALVVEPDFIYFDEPFTALDAALKRRMQDLVIMAAGAARFAALFITHDLMEAARIAHRVLVMDTHGRGIAGERRVPGEPGARSDEALYRLTDSWHRDDPLFRHIFDVDERRIP